MNFSVRDVNWNTPQVRQHTGQTAKGKGGSLSVQLPSLTCTPTSPLPRSNHPELNKLSKNSKSYLMKHRKFKWNYASQVFSQDMCAAFCSRTVCVFFKKLIVD